MHEADVQVLLREIMPVTQQGLEQQMGFPPMGAVIAMDGSVRRLPAEESSAAKLAAELLRERLRLEVETGTVRLAAMAADVMIRRRSDGDEASNAVSVHVEHLDGYCVDLLIPYKVRKGLMSRIRQKPQVMFRQMIAQESEPVFFSAVESTRD
jgi:hypothetical protein